jgi:hypothetical protein
VARSQRRRSWRRSLREPSCRLGDGALSAARPGVCRRPGGQSRLCPSTRLAFLNAPGASVGGGQPCSAAVRSRPPPPTGTSGSSYPFVQMRRADLVALERLTTDRGFPASRWRRSLRFMPVRTRPVTVLAVAALIVGLAACFPAPRPPAALVITNFVITSNCDVNTCTPAVSGTVTNTGGSPTGTAPVTVDLSGIVTINGQMFPLGLLNQDIACAPNGLAAGASCTFSSPVIGDPLLPSDDDVTYTAIASDGTYTSPPATASDPLNAPA